MQSRELIVPDDSTEQQVIDLFIRLKRSPQTQRAYLHDIGVFQAFVQKPLGAVTLSDALDFLEHLDDLEIVSKSGKVKPLEDNSKRRVINSIKSFYSFCYEAGVFRANVFRAVKPPTSKSAVSHRILPETTVLRMIDRETDQRDHAILHTLYNSGLRVSELCNLRWRSVVKREDGVQLDVIGKGDKPRSILLTIDSWEVIEALHKPGDTLDSFVFQSRQKFNREHEPKEQRMDPTNVFRVVREAAKRAGVENWYEVSPHWLRHCHGSHALDRGAPLPVVRDTLGHSNVAVTNTYLTARPGQSSAHFLARGK